jgi:hypothetical protein
MKAVVGKEGFRDGRAALKNGTVSVAKAVEKSLSRKRTRCYVSQDVVGLRTSIGGRADHASSTGCAEGRWL